MYLCESAGYNEHSTFRHSVKLVLNKLLFGILWHYHLYVWIKHVPHKMKNGMPLHPPLL